MAALEEAQFLEVGIRVHVAWPDGNLHDAEPRLVLEADGVDSGTFCRQADGKASVEAGGDLEVESAGDLICPRLFLSRKKAQ